MKVIVLGGGDSPEREVSLRSAKSVAEAARAAGFDVEQLDPADGFEQLDALSSAVVLPILHGKNGEDGVIQKELEKRNLPFLGSGSASSADCFDKWRTRQLLEAAGINMAKAALVDKKAYHRHELAKKPHVLKVVHGGSSIGTLVVKEPANLKQPDVDEIFDMETTAVLEELVAGDEITVPILGKQALPVIEIIPPENEEFDYDNKYNGKTQELCPPANISAILQNKGQFLAEKVHATMGCRHLSRVDMMIDSQGEIYVLEINTMPGMTNQSLYPRSAAVAGYSMPELVRKFVDMAQAA